MSEKLFDDECLKFAPFRNYKRRKGTGNLYCGTCSHRIPSRIHSDPPFPKYPHCPWCGAKVRDYD